MSVLKAFDEDDLVNVSGGRRIGDSDPGLLVSLTSNEKKTGKQNGYIGSVSIGVDGDSSTK